MHPLCFKANINHTLLTLCAVEENILRVRRFPNGAYSEKEEYFLERELYPFPNAVLTENGVSTAGFRAEVTPDGNVQIFLPNGSLASCRGRLRSSASQPARPLCCCTALFLACRRMFVRPRQRKRHYGHQRRKCGDLSHELQKNARRSFFQTAVTAFFFNETCNARLLWSETADAYTYLAECTPVR